MGGVRFRSDFSAMHQPRFAAFSSELWGNGQAGNAITLLGNPNATRAVPALPVHHLQAIAALIPPSQRASSCGIVLMITSLAGNIFAEAARAASACWLK